MGVTSSTGDRHIRQRAVVATVVAAGLVGTAVAANLTAAGGTGRSWIVAAFTICLALDWAHPIFVNRGEDSEAFQLDEAFFAASLLLLPSQGTLIAFVLAPLAVQVLRRRPLERVAFNTAQSALAASLGIAAASAVGIGSGAPTARTAVAVVVGCAVFLAVNATAVSAVIASADSSSFVTVARDGLGFRMLVWAASVAIGLLGGLAGAAWPWAALVALVPMGVVQAVLWIAMRARRDRANVDGLLSTALAAHASVRGEDVEAALVSQAAHLLQARTAEVRSTPANPAKGELGGVLWTPNGSARWLVVGDKRGFEPFDGADAKLLDAIVAVGSSAFHNVELVDAMRHQALHDALTGLPNQILFDERVASALTTSRRTGEHVAVLFVDLDRFKEVNDTFGHAAGNLLLQETAVRLSGCIRDGDTVARMSGDEFTVLLPGLTSASDALRVTEKVLAALRRPYRVEDHDVFVTPSVGVAVAPEHGTTLTCLLRHADTAMYRAKEQGRNSCVMWSTTIESDGGQRLLLEADLHGAVERGELTVVFQPQVELRRGGVVGVEALVRWSHPSLGPVRPDIFIPLAEENGLIVPLDEWVLNTACAEVQRWNDAGLQPVRLAVNLSGRAFQRADVVATVRQALVTSGLPAEQLEIEITESVAVDASEETIETVSALRAMGVKVAIDDFGTGYSMLTRLRQLPIDVLKIDQSFVSDIGNDDPAAGVRSGQPSAIVTALIALGHSLGMEVVAEGVETVEQWHELDRLECDRGQGFFFSRPVPGATVEAMLGQTLPVDQPLRQLTAPSTLSV